MKSEILILFLALTPVMLRAQVNYAVSGGTAYVASSANVSGDVVIAASYDGYPVTSISLEAFFQNPNITSVTIPNSVTSIGEQAFSLDDGLTSAIIPNSVTSIEGDAFSFTGLTNVTIPSSVTSIEDRAFAGCTSLTNIFAAPNNPSFSSLNGVLFDKAQQTLIQYPAGLTNSLYIIPKGVTCIGEDAFLDCVGLTSVTLPSSMTSVGTDALAYCTSLTSITIPNSVTNIEDDAFFGCGLANFAIPGSITSLGVDAFADCSSLTNVTIPNSVTSIGGLAFEGCRLTSVTIPASVTSIGGSAFYEDFSLRSVYFQGNAPAIGAGAFLKDAPKGPTRDRPFTTCPELQAGAPSAALRQRYGTCQIPCW